MKKIVCLLLVMTLALGLLAGCGSQKKTEEKPLREMNVVLDWYPNALHAFLYTAIERGYFAEEGLDVKIQFPANENDALALVSAGRAEIGLYYEHDVIQAVANQGGQDQVHRRGRPVAAERDPLPQEQEHPQPEGSRRQDRRLRWHGAERGPGQDHGQRGGRGSQ